MAAFLTSDEPTTREDLVDMVWNATASERAFSSSIGQGRADATKHEWATDVTRAGVKTNKVVEGAAVTAAARAARKRLANHVQLADEDFSISSTQQKIGAAGVSDEWAYELTMAYKELLNDVEASLVSDNPAVARDGSTAGQSAGLEMFLSTNTDHGTNGVTPALTSGAPTVAITDGDLRTFAESHLKTALRNIYTNCGEQPDLILLPTLMKERASGFTGVSEIQTETGEGRAKIIGGAYMYIGEYWNNGILMEPHRYLRARTGVVLNTDYWELCWLVDPNDFMLGKQGHSDEGVAACEYTLACRDEHASAKIADLQ